MAPRKRTRTQAATQRPRPRPSSPSPSTVAEPTRPSSAPQPGADTIGTTLVPPSDDDEYDQWTRKLDHELLSSPRAGPSRYSDGIESDSTTSTVLRFQPLFSSGDYDSPPISEDEFGSESPPSRKGKEKARIPSDRMSYSPDPLAFSQPAQPPRLFSSDPTSPAHLYTIQPSYASQQSQLESPPQLPLHLQPQSPARSRPSIPRSSSPTSSQPIPSFRTRPVPSPPPVFADPALEAFRSARTFRTRTALQLQPYTKERQIYERALRHGRVPNPRVMAESAEVRRDEEEDVSESSEAAEGEDETPATDPVVIGNTPPPRPPRPPVTLVDEDFDEYFFEHGVAADEEDEGVVLALQKIARKRLKAAKEERKKKREAERTKREFERLMRERQRDEREVSSEGEKERPIRREGDDAARRAPKTPGLKTYGRVHREQRRKEREFSDGSLSPPPPLDTTFDFNGDDDFAHMPIFDDHSYDDYEPARSTRTPSAFDVPTKGSFLINDMPPPTARRKRIISSPSSSNESLSDPPDAADTVEAAKDKRAKIARRMLPVAMLNRLEREAKEKEAQRLIAKRQSARPAVGSPVRPGRAVVKRGAGPVNLDDMSDLFGDESEASDSDIWPSEGSRSATSAPLPIEISSDSEKGWESEAMEDNRQQLSLAHLQRGEFEDILAGRTTVKRSKQSKQSKQTRLRHRRPALGLAPRQTTTAAGVAPKSTTSIARPRPARPPQSPLVQTRLEFPTARPPARNKPRRMEALRRPAIRLRDNVIFTQSDFAFDNDNDDLPEPRPAAPKQRAGANAITTGVTTGGTPDRTGPEAEAQLDEGVGRARSWANFDRFPIDFDISPLPSGVFCSPTTVAGSGRLERLVGLLKGGTSSVGAGSVYGIELGPELPTDELLIVLPIVFDRLQTKIVAFTADRSAVPDTAPLGYLCELASNVQDSGVQAAVTSGVRSTLEKIDQMVVGESKYDRSLAELLLLVRWHLFELAIRTKQLVDETCRSLLEALFAFGFDRTIKPLKAVLRGDADTPEINDLSVSLWVSTLHVLAAYDPNTFSTALNAALDATYRHDQVGPLAAERIWFVVFGLCALSQFDADGVIGNFQPSPRWGLVKRAIGLIKVAHSQQAEENAHLHQLQGRDRYIKVMIARCVRLSSVWKWPFDRDSFSVATRDLGMIFKERQHRNLPTEPAVDFPDFITQFDISLTAAEDTRDESAFELWLRLACVAASDLISSAQAMDEAQQAERDVQRLIMSIFPLSSVAFTRARPPTRKQLGALINRYSTMIVACYFSPSLLPWLLANSRKWIAFDTADLESRQVCIRGLMYLAVACRHHAYPLDKVVERLADILATLHAQLDHGPPSRLEIERTMVLVVTCFRQIIARHSFDQLPHDPVYPDPALLHESWTGRIFELDLAKDVKAGLEIVATIQAFLDARAAALPQRAKRAREAKISESFDDYPSLGFDFDDVDLAALGGDERINEDPIEKKDAEFAQIILNVICPKIYRLLSDILPPEVVDTSPDRQVFLTKLTKCWSDCAGIVVVEHGLQDWSSYVGPFGSQSWSRLGNEFGRVQVGLNFMLNVARLDPGAFRAYEEDFVSLLFQVIVTERLSVEHKYVSAVLAMPGAGDYPLFSGVQVGSGLDRESFLQTRGEILNVVFGNIANLLGSKFTPASMKPFIYRCVNLLVSALIANENAIRSLIHREAYHTFVYRTVRSLISAAGKYIHPDSIPGLKHLCE